MKVLGCDLLVHDLDDVADRDDADQSTRMDHGNLGDPPVAHRAHNVVDIVEDIAGAGITGHDFGDSHPAESLAPIVDNPQDIPLREDSDQPTIMINYRQRSDVILHEPGDRFVYSRFRVDRDDSIPFGVQDIANQHSAPSPSETRAQQRDNRSHDALELKDWTWGLDSILTSFRRPFNFFFGKIKNSRQNL